MSKIIEDQNEAEETPVIRGKDLDQAEERKDKKRSADERREHDPPFVGKEKDECGEGKGKGKDKVPQA